MVNHDSDYRAFHASLRRGSELAAEDWHAHHDGARSAAYQRLDTTSSLARYGWAIVLLYLFVGTETYCFLEGWDELDSLYFCCVLLSTVGYGDMDPTNWTTKAFTVVFVIVGHSLVATSLGVMLGHLESQIQRKRGKRRQSSPLWRIFNALLTICILAMVGATFVHVSEGWSWEDSFYWAVITCSSIGLGDLTPKRWQTRLFAVVYLLLAVGGFAMALGSIATVIMDMEQERAIAAFVARGVSAEMIMEMDADKNGSVDKVEFLEHMLVNTGKVERGEIREILALFDSFDVDGGGTIGPEDVINRGRDPGRHKPQTHGQPHHSNALRNGQPNLRERLYYL